MGKSQHFYTPGTSLFQCPATGIYGGSSGEDIVDYDVRCTAVNGPSRCQRKCPINVDQPLSAVELSLRLRIEITLEKIMNSAAISYGLETIGQLEALIVASLT